MAPRSLTPEEVRHTLLNLPPLVADEIQVRQIYYPTPYSTLAELKTWPFGTATSMKQTIMLPNMPEIERDFKQWKDLSGADSGCEGCPPPGCTVQATKLGGHAFAERVSGLMQRDYETEDFCVEEIQNTADYDKLFTQITDNLSNTIEYIKEHSIFGNFMNQISTKLVIDSEGIKANTANPFTFPDIGDARVSAANIDIFTYIYGILSRMEELVAADMVDGRPMFNTFISQELLSDIYRLDPNARRDLHYSDQASELIKRLAPKVGLRDEFVVHIADFPRRFKLEGETNRPKEIFPIATGVRGQAGYYATRNAEYFNATHETVAFYPMTPITVWTKGNVTELPGGMKFGTVPSFFDKWEFNNIKDTGDNRWQQKGFLQTRATIGLDYEHSDSCYEILFERKKSSSLASFHEGPKEVPEEADITNKIPTAGCPCPQIESFTVAPLGNRYWVRFHRAVEADQNDVIVLNLKSGGFFNATVQQFSPDSRLFEVTVPDGITLSHCKKVTEMHCVNNLDCYSEVVDFKDCRSGIKNAVDVWLKRPLKAYTSTNVLLATFGDGTTANVVLTADADLINNVYSVKYAAGFGPTDNETGSGSPTTLNEGMCCDRGGIVSLCVPTATVAECPGCPQDKVNVEAC